MEEQLNTVLDGIVISPSMIKYVSDFLQVYYYISVITSADECAHLKKNYWREYRWSVARLFNRNEQEDDLRRNSSGEEYHSTERHWTWTWEIEAKGMTLIASFNVL